MIRVHKDKPNAILEFGTGDICIASGYSDNREYGMVSFKNQKSREIGSEGDIKNGLHYDEEFDVKMSFTKTESIDVLIEKLKEAKEFMLDKTPNLE